MNYLIDTNILALNSLKDITCLGDNELEALKTFNSLDPINVYIADLILKEYATLSQKVFTRKYKLNSEQAGKLSKFSILTLKSTLKYYTIVDYDLEDIAKGIKIFEENIESLSLIDSSLIPIAQKYNLKLFTLDRKLQEIAKLYKVEVLGF